MSPDASPGVNAERLLGTVEVARRQVGSAESAAANRAWWDADADDYHREHGEALGAVQFLWCPEGMVESHAHLLGDPATLRGKRVLEVGCGAASCGRWLAAQGASVVGLDLSAGMLRHAGVLAALTGVHVPLVQAGAEQLPFADESFHIACTAFGAVSFVTDAGAVMREVARVLRPGGRWVFAVTHPMQWMFSDDPGEAGLVVVQSYFDRTPYVEIDAEGRPTYVMHHRTLSDRVRDIVAAGLVLEDIVEPEWPPGRTEEWGQWSPMRGALLPGTAIFRCCKPASTEHAFLAPERRPVA